MLRAFMHIAKCLTKQPTYNILAGIGIESALFSCSTNSPPSFRFDRHYPLLHEEFRPRLEWRIEQSAYREGVGASSNVIEGKGWERSTDKEPRVASVGSMFGMTAAGFSFICRDRFVQPQDV